MGGVLQAQLPHISEDGLHVQLCDQLLHTHRGVFEVSYLVNSYRSNCANSCMIVSFAHTRIFYCVWCPFDLISTTFCPAQSCPLVGASGQSGPTPPDSNSVHLDT